MAQGSRRTRRRRRPRRSPRHRLSPCLLAALLAVTATACPLITRSDRATDDCHAFYRSQSVQALASKVDLPVTPESVAWERRPGDRPCDERILAVIDYRPDDLPRVLDSAPATGGPTSAEIPVALWMPPQLLSLRTMGGDGRAKLVGTPRDPARYLRPNDHGQLMQVSESTWFVLSSYHVSLQGTDRSGTAT
jgi:hypothetical protein